jgi:nucleoside-diphosphate-sugar epimerase/acyl carrier protein
MILLLTGANGVFGQSLIRALAPCQEIEKIYALGRRPPSDTISTKIEFVEGDITKKIAIADEIRCKLTAILHAAAETRFSAPLDAARRVNVDGLANVVSFASLCPKLDRITHLSTIYIAGKRTGQIGENELPHSAGFVNTYEQSKFEAEEFLQANATHLPVTICRLSTIVGDSRTGRIEKLNAIHQALRFFYYSLLPMMPGTSETPVDLISSDYAVAAVAALLRGNGAAGKTFHVCAGRDAIPLGELLSSARQCFLQNRPQWRKRAIEMPALVSLQTFELFVRSVEQLGNLALQQSVTATKYFAPQLSFPKTFDDSECARALARSGVERPSLRDFFPRVVEDLIMRNGESGKSVKQFELALLSFINTKLLAGSNVTVNVDSALFTDGIIDSLKILHLLGFIESAVGRPIPDEEVVMEHFRSVRVIAERFAAAAD